MKKLKLAENTSDLETEDEDVATKKRKENARKVLDPTDTSDEETHQKGLSTQFKKIDLPLPPVVEENVMEPIIQNGTPGKIAPGDYYVVNGILKGPSTTLATKNDSTPTKVYRSPNTKSKSTPRKKTFARSSPYKQRSPHSHIPQQGKYFILFAYYSVTN